MEFLGQNVNSVRKKVRIPDRIHGYIGLAPLYVAHFDTAQRVWEMEIKADRSFIRETFYGQQR